MVKFLFQNKKGAFKKGSITLIKGFSGICKTTMMDSFSGFSKEDIWKLKLKNSTKIFSINNQIIFNKLISLLDNMKLRINISKKELRFKH